MTRILSQRSLQNLAECHDALVIPFLQAYRRLPAMYDVGVSEGYRDEETQNEAVRQGRSTLRYPLSKHNSLPSHALDYFPWPDPWREREVWRFAFFAGAMMTIAGQLQVKLRWGGDWDGDFVQRDHSLIDLPHIELVACVPIKLEWHSPYFDEICKIRVERFPGVNFSYALNPENV